VIFILVSFLVSLLSFVSAHYFPWWSVAIIPFFVVLFFRFMNPIHAFFAGFTGVALPWLVTAVMIDMKNNHILSPAVASLFKLPHPALLIIVTGFIGGLVGGLSALSGSYFRALFR
jgi:hypothetical protein